MIKFIICFFFILFKEKRDEIYDEIYFSSGFFNDFSCVFLMALF